MPAVAASCESGRVISAKRFLFNAATFIPGVARLPTVQRVFQRHSIVIATRYGCATWHRPPPMG
jgi:hypothetical protein